MALRITKPAPKPAEKKLSTPLNEDSTKSPIKRLVSRDKSPENKKKSGIRLIPSESVMPEYSPQIQVESPSIKDHKLSTAIRGNKKVKENMRKFDFLPLRMYSYKFFNFLMRGRVDDRSPNLSGDSIQIGYSEVFTLSRVTRYYVVSALKHSTPVALKNYLNRELDMLENMWIQLSMKTRVSKYFVDFTQSHIQAKVDSWIKKSKTNADDLYNGDKNILSLSERMLRSYLKLKANRGYVKETLLVFKLQTLNKEDMLVAAERLEKSFADYGISAYNVRGNVLDFLRGIATISKRKTVTLESSSRIVMTNRDIAETLPYLQGKVGSSGLWAGFDVESGASVYLDLWKTPDAKNILITAESGEGKTYLMRLFLMFHNALKDAQFIRDYKGNEFTEYTKSVGGQIISMTPSKTSFLNTFKIPLNEADTEAELKALFNECYALSELQFLTITEPTPTELKDYKNIFSDYMSYCYDKVKLFINNISTYSNSSKFDIPYLYELYMEFMSSEGIRKAYSEKYLFDIGNALNKYWHPEGKKHEYYSREITIEQLVQARVVCFDYGMAETPENVLSNVEMKLKYIFESYAGSRFSAYQRKKKRWTVKVNEEIQSADDDILRLVSADFTEGRAKMLINYVLGNASGAFSSDSEFAAKIRQNITVRFLGRLKIDARNFYIKQYELQRVEEELESIATDNKYKYHFLLDSTATGERITSIVFAGMPDSVSESKFLKTVETRKPLNT